MSRPARLKATEVESDIFQEEMLSTPIWSERTCTMLDQKLSRIQAKKQKLDVLIKAQPSETLAAFGDFDQIDNAVTSLGIEGIQVSHEEGSSQHNDAVALSLPRESRKALEGHFHGEILAKKKTGLHKLTVNDIIEIHAVLLGREKPEIAGRYRTGAVTV